MIHKTMLARPSVTSDQAAELETLIPGRSCPLSYRYGPNVFTHAGTSPALTDLDILYVVGGLYGNLYALEEVIRLFERESGTKALVFNGDFHWFDKDPLIFKTIHDTVSQYVALRGNVETELASTEPQSDAGCGCSYPAWVADETVERSNRILQTLKSVTTPDQRLHMASLPMWAIATVGTARIAIVHGDAESLAGWGFAQEKLASSAHRKTVQSWFTDAQVDFFACSHTCLPVLANIRSDTDSSNRDYWIVNNGAAGMPNVRNHACGLLTRIARRAPEPGLSLTGIKANDLFVDAIRIDYPAQLFEQTFLALWPEGSDANLSYLSRIQNGPDYELDQLTQG